MGGQIFGIHFVWHIQRPLVLGCPMRHQSAGDRWMNSACSWYLTRKVTNGDSLSLWKLVLYTWNTPPAAAVLLTQCFQAKRTPQQLLQQPLSSLEEDDSENAPGRTSNPGEWEKLCRIGNVLVYIPPPLLLPTSFLRLRDLDVEARETGPARQPPSSSVHYVRPPTYHAPSPRHPAPPFYQSRRERLTHVCIASSVTTIGLG